MLVVLGLVAIGFAVVLLICWRACNAPEGYEDEVGFHLIRERARGAEVLVAKTRVGEPRDAAILEKPRIFGAPR